MLIETRPGLALGLTQAFRRHVAEVYTRIAELSTAEVERRVASALLRLTSRAPASLPRPSGSTSP